MGVVVVIITTAFVGTAFLRAPAAEAQFSPYIIDLLAAQQRTQKSLWDKIKDIADKIAKQAEKVWKTSGDIAYKNALRVFLGKIAEDTATWVASAGTGQKPLFITDGNYFKDLGYAAAGDFLDTLATETYGRSLCDPGTYKLQIDIAVRTKLNPNFCAESCQKNADVQKDQEVAVGVAPATFNLSLNNARATRTTLQGWVDQGKNMTGSDRMLLGCPDPMTTSACLESYNTAIAIAEQNIQTNLRKCQQACNNPSLGLTRRQSSCSLSKIKENIGNASVGVGLSISSGGYCDNNRGLSCTKNSDCGEGRCIVTKASVRSDALQKAFEDGDLPKIFDPGQNPLGQFLSVTEAAQQAASEKEEQEKNLITFGAALPVRSLISNKVKTPSSITTSAAQEGLSPSNAAQSETKQTGSPVADAFGIFTKTLTSKLIERIFNKGIVDDSGNPKSLVPGTIGTVRGGVQAARERFASLSQVSLGTGGSLDTLTDLSSCPSDVAVASQTSVSAAATNNCVIESSFRQAVEERLTVKEALERGLLSDQKVFGFDANGREPDYRNGYPYRSLKILRKYRIVPVGWELAAEYIRDFEKQNVNIRTLMQQFDNADSPYFRLVDPSWVLKAPENICLRTGYSENVVAEEYVDDDGDEGGSKNLDYSKRYCNGDSDANVGKECVCDDGTPNSEKSISSCVSTYDSNDPNQSGNNLPKNKCLDSYNNSNVRATCAFITPRVRQVQRREECVDERTCILENDDGTCKQFGVCTQEEDIWRFNGQSCNSQFASCQTFTNSSGEQVSYVQNSLQKSLCGEDNAGCQQYCTAKDFGTGQWSCTASSPATRRYDNDLQSCDPSAEGCTQLVRFVSGTNIFRNGSFEESTVVNVANNVAFPGWRTGNNSQTCGAQTFAASDAVSGTQSARVQWAPPCVGDPSHYFTAGVETGIPVGGKAFTVSFYAKTEGAACRPAFQMSTGGEYSPVANATLTPEWQRFSYTYTFTAGRTETSFVTFFRTTTDCSYLVDAVQVDEGDQLTDYKDYGAVNQAHLKLPPAQGGYNLGCTGNPTIDPPACANFALKCTADDMGCDLFTPLNGGQSIPAKPGETCPADKVGCASFREQPTDGMLSRVAERTGYYCQNELGDPNFKFVSCVDDTQCGGVPGACQPLVSFIGNTGASCTAQEVGCEAYTNLDEVAKGGEGKVQFTRLQLCVPPDYTGTLANYYSWVGDNESGYQLKQYRLVRSNLDAAPCTNLETNLPLGCVDGTPGHPVASCTAADLPTNPDCAQYYDDGGNTYYRLRSRVIHQTETCHPFRNTIDTLTYYADSGLSTSCSEAAVGCREYVGNTGSNTRVILTSDFERGTYEPWSLANAANPSPESVNYGGHSLDVSGPPAAQADLNGALEQGKSYTVQFWAKARGAAPVNVDVTLQATGVAALGTATISPEWNVYTLGPGAVNFSTAGNNLMRFTGSGDFFIDNVVLTELTDNVYRIKGSQTACGGFEGCQAYRNRNGEVANYLSFAKLCQADRVGCERVINTQNSTTPFSRTLDMPNLRGDVDGNGTIDRSDIDYLIAYTFGGGPPPFVSESGDVNGDGPTDIGDVNALIRYVEQGDATAIVNRVYPNDSGFTPGDTIEFWVNDPAKSCQAEDKGCRALGKQSLGMAKVGGAFQKSLLTTDTVFARDNPDAYTSILCGKDALFCDAFTTPTGSTSYFRDPSNRTCSYREPSGGNAGGWYVDGTSELCPSISPKGIPPEVPNGGFAGNCPGEQSGCGMYLDPLGTGESLTSNNDLEVGAANPQGWTTAFCSNDPTRTCTQNSDCGSGNTCNAGAGMLEYADHGGTKAVRLAITGSTRFRQSVVLQANTFYTISTQVQRGNQGGVPTNEDVRIGVMNCRDASGNGVEVPSPDVAVHTSNQDSRLNIPADQFETTGWRQVSARFFSANAVTCQVFVGADGGTTGHWFDKIQLRTTTSTAVLRQSVDSTSCNGQVGDKLGCRLFNDLSNTGLTYDADQSPVGGSPTDVDSVGAPATCGSAGEVCDSNVLLKVRRDRTCSQWIAPTTTIESTKPTGQKENLTVGLATCDSFSPSGQCNHYVDEMRCANNPKQTCIVDSDCGSGGTCKLFSITGETPQPVPAYTREDLRNKSGYTIAGMSWADGTVQGKFPFGSAPQVGGDGVAVTDELLNGTFDQTQTIATAGWTLSNPDPARTRGTILYSTDDTTVELITEELVDTSGAKAPTQANQRLEITPSASGTTAVTLLTASNILTNRLTPERTYMLAFDIRYLTQPDRSLPEPQTLFRAGISSGTSIDTFTLPDYTWQGTVKPSTQWQRFVIGPLRLDEAATLQEGNTTGATHRALNTENAFAFFTTDATNRTPFSIDNVSLLPALGVAEPAPATATGITGQLSGDAFIARSCRAYPNASALACSYQDDTGKLFQGWQGYCLERDPKNVNNCLTWYPVDLLAGERNIFGKVEAAGYAGPVPLYLCAQESSSAGSSSNYRRNNIAPPMSRMSGDGNWGTTAVTSPFPLSQIASVIVRVSGRSNDEWSAIGTELTATRANGEYECQSGAHCGRWGTSGRTAEPWFVAWCGGNGGDHMDCDKNSILDSWANMSTGFSNDPCNDWEDAEDTDFWGVRLNWAGPDSRSVTAYFGKCDSTPSDGGVAVQLDFIPREMCTLVAQVADPNGRTVAWSQKVNSMSSLVENFDYKQTHDAAPFGRIVPPEQYFDDPTQWDTSAEDGKQAVPITVSDSGVRVNAAYSCRTNNCQPRTCSQTGASCITQAEITACQTAGGVCIGSGPTKHCQGGVARACSTSSECDKDANDVNYACDYGSTVVRGGGVYSTLRRTNTNVPLQHLKLLFANVFNIWQLDPTLATQNYALQAGPGSLYQRWQADYASMPLCGGAFNRSLTTEADILAGRAYCGNLPEVSNIAVNASTQPRVVIHDGEVIQLKFNSYVDPEQLPLRNIAIDWNGDIASGTDRQVVSWGFAPRSDPADPHAVSHVYRVGADFVGSNRCYDAGQGPYKDLAEVQGHEYCVATPRVQIQDNWEWCNYTGTNNALGRCLNASFPVTSSNDYWSSYGGDIIVVR